jgi:hypothetical protein
MKLKFTGLALASLVSMTAFAGGTEVLMGPVVVVSRIYQMELSELKNNLVQPEGSKVFSSKVTVFGSNGTESIPTEMNRNSETWALDVKSSVALVQFAARVNGYEATVYGTDSEHPLTRDLALKALEDAFNSANVGKRSFTLNVQKLK